MSLVQLIYVSSVTSELSDAELDRILESSVRHNAEQEITGLLLYAEGNFMQVLEGSEAAIDETYGRICADARHKNLVLLSREVIENRQFSRWHMGYRRLDGVSVPPSSAYLDLARLRPDGHTVEAQAGDALALLRHFYELNR